MKTIVFSILLISNPLSAQDSNYYLLAHKKSDDSLKFELNQIIKNHTEFTYTSSSTDVWDILKHTDRDTANANNVILLYSGRSVDAAQEYNSAAGWSREHVWAKSRGDFGTGNGAGTDVHHLRPVDVSVNSIRNNRNFDTCITCIDVIDNGFNTGSKRDANLWTFEPPDAVKGDVARMLFYMAVRYEGEGSEPDLELTNTLLNNTDQSPLQARLSTLLHWNRIDSVSDWERNRNNIIDSFYQHNRNPFIDNPELAEYLWGDSIGIIWMPELFDTSIGVGLFKSYISEISIYPNPAQHQITISHSNLSIDSYMILNYLGQNMIENTLESNVVDVSTLPKGSYVLMLRDLNSNKTYFNKFIH
ncbi:endonuclease [Crocinitomicaceae bacterium]|nr:endonuclease [Crocinitomicaceae bacterium]